MNWHFPFLILTTVTLSSVYSQFNSLSLEELGSDTGIQVFNQIIKSRPHENIVVSPHGIASILGMLQLGADGRTKKQLTTLMRYNVNGVGKVLKKVNKAIVSKKNKDIVTVANAVFVKNGFKMEVPFAARNKEVFQCEVQNVNFQDPVSACDSINLWVKNETRVLGVPELGLPRDMLRVQFPGSTSTPNGLWYNFIELPYHGESISMLIALPTENSTPLSAIIPHISTKTIDSWMNTMVPKRMQLVLPKFTAVAQTDLKEPLKALGITEMFEPLKANFAKITRSESLHVSHILQKAKIEVSEDGTKASAATTAILIARSSPPWFIVDRPFLFFIRHNPTASQPQEPSLSL
ncbi:Serpine2 [Phodopus roborovskii]|uniref:Serpine2 protein n=1 Tax=Phodopus roborovskii TaxID=109678 RepID=A0AAU9ZGZ6_PHORO|nr:Serpine2 [Phodopus roborovskii]